jgi:hypothetical protein
MRRVWLMWYLTHERYLGFFLPPPLLESWNAQEMAFQVGSWPQTKERPPPRLASSREVNAAVSHGVACQIKVGGEKSLKDARRQETVLRTYLVAVAGAVPGESTGSSLRMESAKEVRMRPETGAVVVAAAAAAEPRP